MTPPDCPRPQNRLGAMRVLVLLTDGFGGRGGIAKFNRDLLTALCAQAGTVIAVPRLMPEPPGALPERLTHISAGLNSKLRFVAAALRCGFARRPIDLVICAHLHLLPIAWACGRLLRCPLLLLVHGVEAWRPTRSPLVNRLARKADAVVAVSRFTLDKFCRWAGLDARRGFVLPNCVRAEEFGPGPKSSALLQRYGLAGRKVILTLGRLSAEERYKGFDEVLDALPDLARDVPDLSYLIAGDGNDRPRLEQKAQSLGLKDRVIFAGHIREQEKAEHFRLADAFVMPGYGEGFGIVYLEALACGIPVVASRADASQEAVREGQLGIVVDPRNGEELKAGILAALRRPTGVVPAGLDYFSFGNFCERLKGILEAVLKERFPAARPGEVTRPPPSP